QSALNAVCASGESPRASSTCVHCVVAKIEFCSSLERWLITSLLVRRLRFAEAHRGDITREPGVRVIVGYSVRAFLFLHFEFFLRDSPLNPRNLQRVPPHLCRENVPSGPGFFELNRSDRAVLDL